MIIDKELGLHEFRKAWRGYDRDDVDAFANRSRAIIERLQTDLIRLESLLAEHRGQERFLRDALVSAEELAEQVRAKAQRDAEATVHDAESRAVSIVQAAHARVQELERQTSDVKQRYREMAAQLEENIKSLHEALQAARTSWDDTESTRQWWDPAARMHRDGPEGGALFLPPDHWSPGPVTPASPSEGDPFHDFAHEQSAASISEEVPSRPVDPTPMPPGKPD